MWHRAIVVLVAALVVFAGRSHAGELKILTPVTDLAYGQVYEVDQETGEAREVSPAASGSERLLNDSYDIAIAPDGRFVMTQWDPGSFIGVDPATGIQEQLLAGSALRNSWGIVRAPGGVYIALSGGRVVHFDPRTRAMRDVALTPGGRGGGLGAPGLAVDARGRIIMATGSGGSVVRIDPGLGTWETLVEEVDNGGNIWDVAVNENGIIYFSTYGDRSAPAGLIHSYHPFSGERRSAVDAAGFGLNSIAFGTNNALYGLGAVGDNVGLFRFHLADGTYEVTALRSSRFPGGGALTVDRPVVICSCLVPFDRDVLLGPKDGGILPFGVDLFDVHGKRIDAATLSGGAPRVRIEYEPFDRKGPTADLVLDAKLDAKGHIDIDSTLLAKPGRYFVVPVGRSGYDLEPTCIGRIVRKP